MLSYAFIQFYTLLLCFYTLLLCFYLLELNTDSDIFTLTEPRGFGFVTFEDVEAVEYCLDELEHQIDGKIVECKRAVPKEGQVGLGQQHSSSNIAPKPSV